MILFSIFIHAIKEGVINFDDLQHNKCKKYSQIANMGSWINIIVYFEDNAIKYVYHIYIIFLIN